ncbi:uncharacterized protein LOC121055020 [Oryza brachyantha]|uniref:uncharacterized protein LOC121055020 n=1 Tax=Oryza brachyantha TaxID=4533 RepID=UPI001ADD0EEA|nr:uncharacterized protein LOC121055020 [Oryza brachyantha]
MGKRSRERLSGMSMATTAGAEASCPWPPEADPGPSKLITLRVKDSEGVRITRTMRRTDALRDLIGFYRAMALPGDMAFVDAGGVFMHYGTVVAGDKTPADYGMEDSDEVAFFPDRVSTVPITLTVKDGKGRRVTRTMHRFNVLNILFGLHYEMLPPGAPKEGFFVYHGREVHCVMTPDCCKMEDGDEITFVPISKPSAFVTLTMKRTGTNDVDDHGSSSAVTRTMRRTDALQGLVDFYFDMVPTDEEHGAEWDVVYCGKQIDGEKTPADYEMEDGDQLRLVPASKRSAFVTITLAGVERATHTFTIRRTDKLQGLVDLWSRMAPRRYQHGFILLFDGRRVSGSRTPDNLELEDGDTIDVVAVQVG